MRSSQEEHSTLRPERMYRTYVSDSGVIWIQWNFIQTDFGEATHESKLLSHRFIESLIFIFIFLIIFFCLTWSHLEAAGCTKNETNHFIY